MKASSFWLILLSVLAIAITVFNHFYEPPSGAAVVEIVKPDSSKATGDSLAAVFTRQDSLAAFIPEVNVPKAEVRDTAVLRLDSVYDIEVQKSAFKLIVNRNGRPFKVYNVAVGNQGSDKLDKQDMITPLGRFPVLSIENSSQRSPHHGRKQGAWFIRLLSGHAQTASGKAFSGIGIHGGGQVNEMGHSLATDCIVMQDSDLLELKGYINEEYKQYRLFVRITP